LMPIWAQEKEDMFPQFKTQRITYVVNKKIENEMDNNGDLEFGGDKQRQMQNAKYNMEFNVSEVGDRQVKFKEIFHHKKAGVAVNKVKENNMLMEAVVVPVEEVMKPINGKIVEKIMDLQVPNNMNKMHRKGLVMLFLLIMDVPDGDNGGAFGWFKLGKVGGRLGKPLLGGEMKISSYKDEKFWLLFLLYYVPVPGVDSPISNGDVPTELMDYVTGGNSIGRTRIEDVEAENDRKIELQGSHWRFN